MMVRVVGFERVAIGWSHLTAPWLIGLALLAGCGGEKLTAVRGAISYKGKPVTHGVINFKSGSAQPFGGAIKDDGSYEFQIPPGDYQVRIDAAAPAAPNPNAAEGVAPPRQSRLAPEKFADYSTSGLTATVNADGSQTIDFNLQ